jgi:deltex
MKRTRRQMMKEDFEKESDVEDINEFKNVEGNKKNNKRAKKDKIINNDVKVNDDETIMKNEMNKNNKKEKEKFSKDFTDLIEKIKTNLNNFGMKPEYCDKPQDENNIKISKLHKITNFKLISPIEIYYKVKYEQHQKLSLEDDKCSICLFNFYDDDLKQKSIEEILILNESPQTQYDAVLLNNCSDHFFHLDCLINLIGDKESAKCPNCNKIYGILTGNQPKGSMKVEIDDSFSCDGYEKVGTIIISYHFPNGRSYSGTSRVAYLPNNKEGREILALFKIAFDRKLTFTIGTSVTTGVENTTIWNGIHHKTNTSGGAQYFGFPDPTYFNRVKQELAAKGVVEDNITESLENIAKSLLKIEENSNIKSYKRNKSRTKRK